LILACTILINYTYDLPVGQATASSFELKGGELRKKHSALFGMEGCTVSLATSIAAALFCFIMVISLLGGLYGLMKLSTGLIRFIEAKMISQSGR